MLSWSADGDILKVQEHLLSSVGNTYIYAPLDIVMCERNKKKKKWKVHFIPLLFSLLCISVEATFLHTYIPGKVAVDRSLDVSPVGKRHPLENKWDIWKVPSEEIKRIGVEKEEIVIFSIQHAQKLFFWRGWGFILASRTKRGYIISHPSLEKTFARVSNIIFELFFDTECVKRIQIIKKCVKFNFTHCVSKKKFLLTHFIVNSLFFVSRV